MSASASSNPARHQGIDLLRLLAAFAVVALHVYPYAALPVWQRESMWLLARFAVPCFFLISGFFAGPALRRDPGRVLRSLGRLLGLFALACAAYLPWSLARGVPPAAMLTPNLLTEGTAFHLWFLPALGFALLMLALARHAGRERWLAAASVGLLAAYIAVNLAGFGSDAAWSLLRFLSGVPLVWFGARLAERAPLGGAAGLALLLGGVALQFLEVHLLRPAFTTGGPTYQFGLGSLAYALGMFALWRLLPALPAGLGATLAGWGRDHALGIYLWHVWALTLVKQGYEWLGIDGRAWSVWLMIPLAFAACLGGLWTLARLTRPALA